MKTIFLFFLMIMSLQSRCFSQDIQYLDYSFWKTYQPLRSVNYNNPFIKDVEEHIPANMAATYRDSDPVTWVHEMTHGINSYLRQKHGGTTRVNAFYVMNGYYAVFKEPNCRKSDAIRFIPDKYKRSSLYSLYVSGQREWDDCPLYLIDEWVSYTNGSLVGTRDDTVSNMLIFNFYVAGTMQSILEKDPNYQELADLKKFMLWNIARSFKIAEKYPKYNDLVEDFKSTYFKEDTAEKLFYLP